MAYPEPNSLDDINGPGAEDADPLAEYDEGVLGQCAVCGHTWPSCELEDGVCPDCLLERHYEARRRRDKYERIVDGEYRFRTQIRGCELFTVVPEEVAFQYCEPSKEQAQTFHRSSHRPAGSIELVAVTLQEKKLSAISEQSFAQNHSVTRRVK